MRFWEIRSVEAAGAEELPAPRGRFVLHRHHDALGPHLDLRLEEGDHCAGLRIDADALEPGAWASEKAAHPLHWLEQDGEAVRLDAGTYAWRKRDSGGGELLLQGQDGVRIAVLAAMPGLPAKAVRELAALSREETLDACSLAALARDGLAARRRALARLLSLGRELDGGSFDEAAWREMLAGRDLQAIHGQLEAFERRWDAAHPPERITEPAPLEETEAQPAAGARVLSLLHGGY